MPDKTNIYQYDAASGTWIPAVGAALSKRLTAAGAVIGAHAVLHWMILRPSAVGSIFELSDDTDGSTAVVLDAFFATRDTVPLYFVPPMHFANGIYAKTLTNATSVTFGYNEG